MPSGLLYSGHGSPSGADPLRSISARDSSTEFTDGGLEGLRAMLLFQVKSAYAGAVVPPVFFARPEGDTRGCSHRRCSLRAVLASAGSSTGVLLLRMLCAGVLAPR